MSEKNETPSRGLREKMSSHRAAKAAVDAKFGRGAGYHDIVARQETIVGFVAEIIEKERAFLRVAEPWVSRG